MDAEIWLRSKLRRFGLTRYLRPQRAAASFYYRRKYASLQPREVELGFGNCKASLRVTNASDFVTLMGKKEDTHFMRLLSRYLSERDCFWDVGSNIGFYALLASKLVGQHGHVLAFEPEPHSRARLQENLSHNGVTNVRVLDCALGNSSGEFELEAAPHATAGVHRLVAGRADQLAGGTRVRVRVERGDDLAPTLRQPNVVKIDVEGAEIDVIEGMRNTLTSADCRAVFCEVHFGQLEARGTPLGPRDIEAKLRAYGLRQQRWVDASHLLATR